MSDDGCSPHMVINCTKCRERARFVALEEENAALAARLRTTEERFLAACAKVDHLTVVGNELRQDLVVTHDRMALLEELLRTAMTGERMVDLEDWYRRARAAIGGW